MEVNYINNVQQLFDEQNAIELLSIAQDIAARNFSFDREMHEISSIKFLIQPMPEEAMAEFNILYSNVQSHHSRVSSILIDIYREKLFWDKTKSRLKKLYGAIKNNQLATRTDIKQLRNKELQEAVINHENVDLVKLIDNVESVLEDLKGLISIVQIKNDELDKANTNLNRQQKITESLIGLNYPVRAKRNI